MICTERGERAPRQHHRHPRRELVTVWSVLLGYLAVPVTAVGCGCYTSDVQVAEP